MQTNNPFELILSMLDQLQTTVNTLSENSQKSNQMPATNPERLLDLAEAAAIMRKPVGTVRHYIHHRQLPAIRIGKSYLIKLNELLDWVNRFKEADVKEAADLNPMLTNRKRYVKSSNQLINTWKRFVMSKGNKKLEHIRLERYLTNHFHFQLN